MGRGRIRARPSSIGVLLLIAGGCSGASVLPPPPDLFVPGAAPALTLPAVQPASLLWVDATGLPNAAARDALAALDHAAGDGLDPADYGVADLDRLIARLQMPGSGPDDVAAFESVLTDAMSEYLRHLHMGRVDPRAIGFRVTAPIDRHDFQAVVRAAAASGAIDETVDRFRPAHAQYGQLRRMLSRYRQLADDETLEAPDPTAKALHAGDPYAGAGVLASLLTALGDLPPDERDRIDSARYDGALVEAVTRFQRRHGIEADGVAGAQTFAALRVPLAWRVRQIELALERLRWLPHTTDTRQILVNIPMFHLWAWDEGQASRAPAFALDVIVGRALSTETPLFVEEMREVIFRPYWNIPPSILRNEILPKIGRDPDYLRRNDMEIVGWDSGGVPRVRQRPGPHNSLGLIKFVFPNQENVYMHGTPAQELFSRSRRDFSHGCVRVSDPVALAEWALEDQPPWTRDRILAATAGSQTIHVKLLRPIQVILFYTTAAASPDDGTLRLADDIYRHDARLDRALAARPPARGAAQ